MGNNKSFINKMVILLFILLFAMGLEAEEKIETPIFSHESGFYEKEFKLTLSHIDPNVKIYYTLDGSMPDPENLNGSTYLYKNQYAEDPSNRGGALLESTYQTHLFENHIIIKNRSKESNRIANISTTFDLKPDYFPKKTLDTSQNNIFSQINQGIDKVNRRIKELNLFISAIRYRIGLFFKGTNYKYKQKEYIPLIQLSELEKEDVYLYKGTPVKAFAVSVDNSISKIVTKIFFIGKDSDFTIPIINITVPEKDLFDYENGIFVAGKDFDKWFYSGREIDLAKIGIPANWMKSIKLNAHMHLFYESKVRIDQPVSIRTNGSSTRALRNKSFRIYPQTKDNKEGIDYSLFADGITVGTSRIVMRNAGQHSGETYLADAAIQRAVSGLNFGVQRYQPIVTFYNGEYNGILNARDRQDKYYLSNYYKLPNNKVDLINNEKDVKEGDIEHWNKTIQFVKDTPKEDYDFFPELEKWIDVASFIDYQATQIYIANTDWPGNNIRYWRYKGTSNHPLSKTGFTDGRWRWLLFDLDASGSGKKYEHFSLDFATIAGNEAWPNPDWSTFMLRTLLENSEFKQRFITRFSDLLNSTFESKRMIRIIRDAESAIESEMPRHIERWNEPRSIQHWRDSIDKLVDFFNERPSYQWKHLQDFFNLGERYNVSIQLSEKDSGIIQLNTLTIGKNSGNQPLVTNTQLPWKGYYFQKLPLSVEVVAANGYIFSHWEADGLTKEQIISNKLIIKPENNINLKAVMLKN